MAAEQHHGTRPEFKDYLPTRSTGSTGLIVVSTHRDGPDLHFAPFGRDGRKDGRTLRANGQTIGRIFHVAAVIKGITVREHRRSDTKVRIGRIGILKRSPRR